MKITQKQLQELRIKVENDLITEFIGIIQKSEGVYSNVDIVEWLETQRSIILSNK